MTPREEQIIDLVADAVPAALRRRFPARRDLCVLSSRAGFDALRYFGVDAKPIVVSAIAMNRAMYDYLEERPLSERVATQTREEIDREVAANGAWMVEIDERQVDDHRYPGHVVLWAEPLLIDLSLAQFDRPQKGIVLPDAVVARVDPAGLWGSGVVAEYEAGAVVAYRARTGAPDFRRAPDWRMKNPVSGSVIREIREALES